MPGFSIDGEDYYVEYEGLHLLCSSCGIYGHKHEICSAKKKQDAAQKEAMTEIGVDVGDQMMQDNKDTAVVDEQWKVVQRPRCQKLTKEKSGDQLQRQSQGSWFALLADVEGKIQQNHNVVMNKVPLQGVTNVLQSENKRTTRLRSDKSKREGHVYQEKRGLAGADEEIREVQNVEKQQLVTKRRVDKWLRDIVGKNEREVEKESDDTLMIVMGEDKMNDSKMDPVLDVMKKDVGLVDNDNDDEAMPYDPRDNDGFERR